MATAVGNIDAFDENVEDIECYLERVEQFIAANGIDGANNRDRAVLLSVVGSKVYQLLRNLTAPAKPSEKSYAELKTLLKTHYRPKRNVTTERYRFQSRVQKQGESIPDYVAALKQLCLHCEFGGDLQPRLRDAFVFGLANTDTKKRLLQKDNLNLDAAVSAATAIEQANADAVELSRDSKSVNMVRNQERQRRSHRKRTEKPPKAASSACYRCGRSIDLEPHVR